MSKFENNVTELFNSHGQSKIQLPKKISDEQISILSYYKIKSKLVLKYDQRLQFYQCDQRLQNFWQLLSTY